VHAAFFVAHAALICAALDPIVRGWRALQARVARAAPM